jgi:PAS domain-containing protein
MANKKGKNLIPYSEQHTRAVMHSTHRTLTCEQMLAPAMFDSLALLNNLTDLIIILDKSGQIYFCNQPISS